MTTVAQPSTTNGSTGIAPSFNSITIGGKIGGVRGLLKMTSTVITWKSDTNKTESVNTNDIETVNWIRITPKVFQLSLVLKNNNSMKFDGFREQDIDMVKKFFGSINLSVDNLELSTRGSNYGEVKITNSVITFMSGDKLAFEIPTSEIAQSTVNIQNKNELTLEFSRDAKLEKDDESLVEIRFYAPTRPNEEDGVVSTNGTTKEKEKKKKENENGDKMVTSGDEEEEEEEEDDEDEDEDEGERPLTRVEVLQQMIKDKTEVVSNAGMGICVLSNVPFITPRGRIDIEMYPTFLKLHGKTHDYKVTYNHISRLFQFQHPDGRHIIIIIGMEPPIRQGKTTYPYLVIQMQETKEETTVDIKLNEEITQKYPTLSSQMKGTMNSLITKLLRVFTGKKITDPGTFQGETGYNSVKCSLKANEGLLFPLERSFFFINKPPTYVKYDEISAIEFSRVGATLGGRGAGGSSRTFDMTVLLKSGGSFIFTSILRAEYEKLYSFLKEKKISIETPDQTGPQQMLIDDDDSDDEDYVPSDSGESEESDETDEDDEDESEEESKKKRHKKDK